MRARHFLSALTLTATLALPGCTYFDTLGECGDLASTINPSLAWIAERGAKARLDPAAYRAMAEKYSDAAVDLKRKQYASMDLTALAVDYAKLLAETSSNTDVYASALETNDARVQRIAMQTSRQHASRQRSFVRRIGRFAGLVT